MELNGDDEGRRVSHSGGSAAGLAEVFAGGGRAWGAGGDGGGADFDAEGDGGAVLSGSSAAGSRQ